jgi:protein-disulfide isomerase
MAFLLCASAQAADKDTQTGPRGAAAQEEAAKVLGPQVKIDKIEFVDALQMYRLEVQGNAMFITPDMHYVFIGDIIDMKTKQSIVNVPKKVDFSARPLKDAIRIGNGPHKIALFMSLRCPHCHNQYKDLVKNKKVTTYVYMYPDAGGVWCSPDRAKALDEAIQAKIIPSAGSAKDCDLSALKRNVELARSKNIRGTPTIVFSNGESSVGYINTAMLDEKLAEKGK